LPCNAGECKACEKGFFQVSKPVMPELPGSDCECQCGCEQLSGLKKPSYMKWLEPAKEKTFRTYDRSYKADVATRDAKCNAYPGKHVVGCLSGKPVNVQCGCKSLFYLQGFTADITFPVFRSADEDTFAWGFWRSAIPPDEKTKHWLNAYLQICQFGANWTLQTGDGCVAEKPLISDTPENSSDTSQGTNHAKRALLSAAQDFTGQGTKSSAVLQEEPEKTEKEMEPSKFQVQEIKQAAFGEAKSEKETKSDEEIMVKNQRLTNKGFAHYAQTLLTSRGHKMLRRWKKDGFIDPSKHSFMRQSHIKNQLAYGSGEKEPGLQIGMQAVYENQMCYQSFEFKWTVCGNHKGDPIQLFCRTEIDGDLHEIPNAGCHCNDVYMHGEFTGFMPVPSFPKPCASKFIENSVEARNRYLVTAPYRACGMKLHRQCEERKALVRERKAKGEEQARQSKERKNKPLYKMIRAYDKGMVDSQRDLDTMAQTMQQSQYNYYHIPGLKLEGQPQHADSNVGCRHMCNMKGNCLSYSYSQEDFNCFMSEMRLNYDPGYTLYVKIQHREGLSAHAKFFTLPGISGGSGAGNGGDGAETYFSEKMSFGECKYDCFKDEQCQAFSYNQESHECNGMDTGINYNANYQYYEKQQGGLKGGRAEDIVNMNNKFTEENTEKKRLKEQLDTIMYEENRAQKAAKESKEKKEADKAGMGDSEVELGATRGSTGGGWQPMNIETSDQPSGITEYKMV